MTIDIDDIEILLGRAFTSLEVDRVNRLAEMAEGLIESALPGFSVATGSETAIVLPGDPSTLWTPRYPVTAIDTIAVDGNAITGWEWDEKGRITFAASGVEATRLDLDRALVAIVEVTYDFGLDPAPADVAFVVAAMVAAALRRQTNLDGVQSESLGAYQVSYGDWSVREAAAGMTFPEGALRRWKRNRQVSVPLVAR